MASILVPRVMTRMDFAFENVKHELLKDCHKGHRVLDVGCGGGGYLKYFENKEVSLLTQLEPNPYLIPVIRTEVAKFRQRNPDFNVEVVNRFVHELALQEKYDVSYFNVWTVWVIFSYQKVI
jgi:SAM-dependent methyltransferase